MKKILALIGLGLLAISGNAFAGEDGKAYNGQGCDNYYSGDSAKFDHQYDGIKNVDSFNAHYVSCPIVVDEIANTKGTTQVYVRWSGSGTLSCYLYSFDVNGAVKQSQSGTLTGGGWLSIPNLNTDDYWGNYSMHCYLPAGGVLQTYWIGEQQD
ncbi:MAG: hypothetical protein PHO08_04805 [Methylococcales bacterium]|nr:hypothetical protein [Methylococcales bacterium]MDD5632261.1 hypothetical protein [Methylococcales bacterium]